MNIPALRGQIGETVFYSANLSMEQISRLVVPVNEELYTAKSLRDQLQRSLNNNYLRIKEYILSRPDRFFNALVLAVYDGDPTWTEIRYELDDERFNDVGILSFDGKEKIFPVDGQHRVEGIRAAIKDDKSLDNEKLCVMIIGHSNTPAGKEKTRRIFSTLNRYAKPVKLGDIIALDEDDIVAIATRYQLENNDLFKDDRVKASNSIALSVSDKRSFTSLIALYTCHLELFVLYYRDVKDEVLSSSKLKSFLKNRPDEKLIEGYISFLNVFWETFIHEFPEVQEYIKNNSQNAAEQFRPKREGGNILFRPVSLVPFVASVAGVALSSRSYSLEEIMKRYSSIERNVSASPWVRIIWDPVKKSMITRTGGLVKNMILSMFDPSLLDFKEYNKLVEDFQSIFGIEREAAVEKIAQLKLKD